MSIQDKIFDVEAALKRKPEAKLFEELVAYIGSLEARLEAPIRELEYKEVDFYETNGPPSVDHYNITQHIERGWQIVQMVSWRAWDDIHWRVILVRPKR